MPNGLFSAGVNVVPSDGRVVFRATIEHNVQLRDGSRMAGELTIRVGGVVREGAIAATRAKVDARPMR